MFFVAISAISPINNQFMKHIRNSIALAYFTITAVAATAQEKPIPLEIGSTLTYDVVTPAHSFKYVVTIAQKTDTALVLNWKAALPKNVQGVVKKAGTIMSVPGDDQFVSLPFSAGTKVLGKRQICLFAPFGVSQTITDFDEIYSLRENNNTNIYREVDETIGYRPILLNGKTQEYIYSEYAHEGTLQGWATCEQTTPNAPHFLSFYRNADTTIQLVAVATPTKAPAAKGSPAAPSTAKANTVKPSPSVYPILLSLNTYSRSAKPSIDDQVEVKETPETYDHRKASNSPNPPSLADCLPCDLRILYNQRAQFTTETGQITAELQTNSMPESLITALFNIYLKKSPTAIPGYRPLTHAAFIKSLTPDARKKLALEIERYVATYGILDGL